MFRFHLDPVRAAVGKTQIGNRHPLAPANPQEVVVLVPVFPALADEGYFAGLPAGATENDILLLVQNYRPRQLVLAIGQQNRPTRRKSVNSCEQFVRRANPDHFSTGRRKRRHLPKPGRNRLAGTNAAETQYDQQ